MRLFQKESLGEYGSGWGWEYNTYAHVFDNQAFDNVPTRYKSDGTGDTVDFSQNNCKNDVVRSYGQLLYSGAQMLNQISCNAFTSNGGNWYSWPAATAGGSKSSGNENNSICPKGWQLTVNAASDPKSYYYLIRTAYNIQDSNDNRIRPLPMSFILSGRYYQGALGSRAGFGLYWSSAADSSSSAYGLFFSSGHLRPQGSSSYDKNDGLSVRCVSR